MSLAWMSHKILLFLRKNLSFPHQILSFPRRREPISRLSRTVGRGMDPHLRGDDRSRCITAFDYVKSHLFVCFLILFGFFSCNLAMAAPLYPFDSPKKSAQFNHLLRDLRCLVCQNQDLVDSNASLANDLRREVYTLVQANKSDDDIIHYLTSRYGDFILFKPPVKGVTALLWCGPLLFLLMGLFIFKRTTRDD